MIKMKTLLIYNTGGKKSVGKIDDKLNIKTNDNNLEKLLIRRMKDTLPLRTGKKEKDNFITEIIDIDKKHKLYLDALAEELEKDNLIAFVEEK